MVNLLSGTENSSTRRLYSRPVNDNNHLFCMRVRAYCSVAITD